MLNKFSNPFRLDTISRLAGDLYERQDKVYLAVAALVAACGYLFLVLFPLLTLTGLFTVPARIGAASQLSDWLGVLAWIVITAVSALITFGMFRIKSPLPSGLGIKADKAPRLYELLEELSQVYKLPKFQKVTIHDSFDLEIRTVPRFGLPVLTTHVLYIGLPVLQGLSPLYFKGALAGTLGQHTGEHNRITHWLYSWQRLCEQYQRIYKKSGSVLHIPFRYFFRFYTPFNKAVSVHAVRQDLLEADAYSLQIINDTELADVIIRYEVCKAFLKHKYWPKIFAMLRKQPDSPGHLPHINMPNILRKALTDHEFAQTMKTLMEEDQSDWTRERPGLHARLEYIGQSKLDIPPPVMETAAQRYLGDAYSAVVKLLDKQWLAKYGKATKKNSAERTQQADRRPTSTTSPETADTANAADSAEENRFEYLSKLNKQGKISQYELFELASLTEKFQDKVRAIALYQQILKQDPRHAQTIFAVGRILLSQNDKSGIQILEKAMQLDKGCIAQACWMLAKYFKSVGDEDTSKKYLERAANVNAAA